MNVLERILLAVAILEIPLQVDIYLFYQEQSANFGAINGINLSVTTLCIFAMYCLWFLDVATLRHRELGRPTVSLPLAAYVGMVGLSILLAYDRFLAISYFTLVLQAFLLFFYVANRPRERNDIVFLTTMMAAALALQSTVIIGSWFVAPRLVGRPIVLGPIEISAWPGRLCGTLTTPVSAGSYLALLLLPVASLLLIPVAARVKATALVAAASASLAICLTQSRGSLAAVGIAAVLLAVMLHARGWLPRWVLLASPILAAIAAVSLWQLFDSRKVGYDDESAVSRVHLAHIAWNLIQDQPVLGVGAGNYATAAEPYANAPPFRSEWFYTVHCEYLLEWAELGLAGLFAFVAFLLGIIHRGWKVWRLRDPVLSPLALAIAVTVLGQMFHMLFDLFNSRPYMQTLWLSAGLMFAMARLAEAGGITVGHRVADSDVRVPRFRAAADGLQSSQLPC